jgi:hypothetical protein
MAIFAIAKSAHIKDFMPMSVIVILNARILYPGWDTVSRVLPSLRVRGKRRWTN